MSRLCVVFKCFDYVALDRSLKKVVEKAKQCCIKHSGPFPLPSKTEYYIVNRSPHVYKKSREQFIKKTHKRYMEFYGNCDVNLIDSDVLSDIIDVKVKIKE